MDLFLILALLFISRALSCNSTMGGKICGNAHSSAQTPICTDSSRAHTCTYTHAYTYTHAHLRIHIHKPSALRRANVRTSIPSRRHIVQTRTVLRQKEKNKQTNGTIEVVECIITRAELITHRKSEHIIQVAHHSLHDV